MALAEAAERGDVSPHSAAQYVGIIRGKEPTGNGSQNAAKRNAWRIHQVLRGIESGELGAKTLAADEESPRSDEVPAPALVVGGYGSLPCLTCAAAVATLARQEICDVGAAHVAGDGSRRPASSPLPRACCRRGAITMSAAALIG